MRRLGSRAGRLPPSLLLLLALGGCAGLDLSPFDGAEAVPSAPRIAVAVREVPGEEVWQVGYALDRPAAGVEFVRDRTAFRRQRWNVRARGADATWQVAGGRERLCFSRPSRAFAVSFRTWTERLPKDYSLHVAFSDGSQLLYT